MHQLMFTQKAMTKITDFAYTVKPVYSNHWREFWKRLHKTGSLYLRAKLCPSAYTHL